MTGFIDLKLSDEESDFLVQALQECEGPANITTALVGFLGFSSKKDFLDFASRNSGLITREGRLRFDDIEKCQIICELMFASDIYGSGLDWEATSGYSNEEGILLLRRVQAKLLNARFSQ